MDTNIMPVPAFLSNITECVYTACYCEENVWKLADSVRENCSSDELTKCFCIFISNECRQVPLWQQKASRNAERLVIWDYHVILIYHGGDKSLVYDQDTELGFPCPFDKYASLCIKDESTLKKEYRRKFRVIPASEFLTTFASDRSHMINESGEWLAPPPQYPPISCNGATNNIDDFISMSSNNNHGEVLDLKTFLDTFQLKR